MATALPTQSFRPHAAQQDMIGASRAMRAVFDLVDRVADVAAPVLVLGETGTGKTQIAEMLHRRSRRAGAPFVVVNCAALPQELLESELFGHVRGAFTGAHAARPGLFAEARGGTLLLDEIGEMAPALQAKLLHVLERRRARPVGGAGEIDVDARIVAATHRNLSAHVRSGAFREDLLYRLDVLSIELCPLRKRPDDILALVRAFPPGGPRALPGLRAEVSLAEGRAGAHRMAMAGQRAGALARHREAALARPIRGRLGGGDGRWHSAHRQPPAHRRFQERSCQCARCKGDTRYGHTRSSAATGPAQRKSSGSISRRSADGWASRHRVYTTPGSSARLGRRPKPHEGAIRPLDPGPGSAWTFVDSAQARCRTRRRRHKTRQRCCLGWQRRCRSCHRPLGRTAHRAVLPQRSRHCLVRGPGGGQPPGRGRVTPALIPRPFRRVCRP